MTTKFMARLALVIALGAPFSLPSGVSGQNMDWLSGLCDRP